MSEPYCYDFPRPAVTVDVAVFRPGKPSWEILLIRRGKDPFEGMFALPGGFVDEMEALDRAVMRELREETGLDVEVFEQLRAYGDPGRDPRGHIISITHCAITRSSSEASGGDDASEARWFRLDELPELAFDHDRIVRDAIEWLRWQENEARDRT